MATKKKKKNRTKKRRKSPIIIAVLLFLLGIFFLLFQVKIPVTNQALHLLEKASHGALDRLSFKAKTIVLDLKGQVTLTEVSLLGPEAINIDKLVVSLSLTDWLLGKQSISSINIHSLNIDYDQLASFNEAIKNELQSTKELQSYFSQFSTYIHQVTVTQNNKKDTLQLRETRTYLTTKGELTASVNIKQLRSNKYPKVENLYFEVVKKDSLVEVQKLKATLLKAKIEGNIKTKDYNQVRGFFKFNGFNLHQFSKDRLPDLMTIKGKASGSVIWSGALNNPLSFNADGHLLLEDLFFSNLPIQKGMVISSYMPSMKELSFDNVTIPQFKLRHGRLILDSIKAFGTPLSFTAKGRIKLPLKTINKQTTLSLFMQKSPLTLDLTGSLDEDFYRSLTGIVKDGLYRDKEKKPTFKCQINGNLQKQSISLEKVVPRVLKTMSRRFGRTLKGIFGK